MSSVIVGISIVFILNFELDLFFFTIG